MPTGHDLGRAAANKVKQQRSKADDALAPFQATVSSFSNGLVYIIEDGTGETPWTQGIRYLNSIKLMVGCRVQIAPTKGGDYVCIGCIDAPDSFAIGETQVYENNTSSAAASPLTSATPTDAITLPVSGLPMGTYRVVVKGSLAVSHSTAGNVDFRARANASNGTSFSLAMPTQATPITNRVYAGHTFTISLNGVEDLVSAMQYSASSGTITARAPEMWMSVKRLT